METEHCMKFKKTQRLVRTEVYMDCLVKQITGIQLHCSNFNRDGGFLLSQAWQPTLKTTNEIAAIWNIVSCCE
jgi:hypothetical protein